MGFNDEEIERERRKAVRKKQHLDEEQIARKAKLRWIFERGSLVDLMDELDAIKKGAGTPEGDALIAHFRRVRGL